MKTNKATNNTMNNTTNNTMNNTVDIPEEVLALMPWYAIGKLPESAQQFFENALLSYPSLQEQLRLEQQMIGLVKADKSLLEKSIIGSPEQRLKAVFNVIDNSELVSKNNKLGVTSLFVDKLKSTLGSLIPSVIFSPQYARFASVSALAISIAVVASYVVPSQIETSDFTPASAVTQPIDNQTSLVKVNTAKTVLLVGFKGTSIELSNNVALKGKNIKIESPANKNEFFQISFVDLMSADDVKQTIDALLAQEDLIWFAGEAF